MTSYKTCWWYYSKQCCRASCKRCFLYYPRIKGEITHPDLREFTIRQIDDGLRNAFFKTRVPETSEKKRKPRRKKFIPNDGIRKLILQELSKLRNVKPLYVWKRTTKTK